MKILAAVLLLGFAVAAYGDAGTIIPRDKQAPDATILSLDEMRVDIVIDNGDAHITIVQIFANRTSNVEEGTYRFSLPTGSTVSDFAVWDGPVRIPAVILERKRAEQVYEEAKAQAIDPGLIEAGERDNTDPRMTRLFSAKIMPIPPFGTKRLELEYHQRLTATDFKQLLALSLKPDAGEEQKVRLFKLHFILHSAHSIESFGTQSQLFPLKMTTSDPNTVEGSFEAQNLSLDDDFKATWQINQQVADKLEVITYHNSTIPQPLPGEASPKGHRNAPEPGFFEAQLLVGDPKPAGAAVTPNRTFLLLFDNSLSMQWEKLERSYAAVEATLHSLKPGDRFNLLLFNQNVTSFQTQPVLASQDAVKQALDFVRASKLRGGTDLLKALAAALAQSMQPDTSIALFTDGGSDRGESVLGGKIAGRYATLWKKTSYRPHTDVFSIGDDANLPLLRKLAENDGFLESVLSTEPVEFHLQSFLSKLTRNPVTGLTLEASPAAQTSYIYPLDDAVYPGSIAQWVGQYSPNAKVLEFTAHARRDDGLIVSHTQAVVSTNHLNHPELPRLWAQSRVNALLEEIDREGETTGAIEEIIRLSRRYKFVTPYTSFLAVPRALLRPRVIRPGDPILRVRTDAEITSVIALFPFGLTKPLRHLASEDLHAPGDDGNRLWETRFLAPPEMKDGTYSVRLILRDTHGNTYREAKTFVIASTPPAVKLQLARTSLHRGEALEIHASASSSTRTLIARIDGAEPVTLRWNARAATNTGTLVIPPDLPIGRYTLTITAEDVAHNLGSQEVALDILP